MTKPPDAASLREVALAHLARYAATQAGLLRVLRRRVQRWASAARAAEAEADTDAIAKQAAAAAAEAVSVVRRLTEAGAVNDAAFATARAARLARAGRSRRAIAAHLAARGVDGAVTVAALADEDIDEWTAAVLFARRRRLGPFRSSPNHDQIPDPGRRSADLAAFARAGFPADVAMRVLALDAVEAQEEAERARRG